MLSCLQNRQYTWQLVCQKVGDFLSRLDGAEEGSAQDAERGNFGVATRGSGVPAAATHLPILPAPTWGSSAFPSMKLLIFSISFAWVFQAIGQGFTFPMTSPPPTGPLGSSGKPSTTLLLPRWKLSPESLSSMKPSLAEGEKEGVVGELRGRSWSSGCIREMGKS